MASSPTRSTAPTRHATPRIPGGKANRAVVAPQWFALHVHAQGFGERGGRQPRPRHIAGRLHEAPPLGAMRLRPGAVKGVHRRVGRLVAQHLVKCFGWAAPEERRQPDLPGAGRATTERGAETSAECDVEVALEAGKVPVDGPVGHEPTKRRRDLRDRALHAQEGITPRSAAHSPAHSLRSYWAATGQLLESDAAARRAGAC